MSSGVTFRNVPNYQLKIRDVVSASSGKMYMPGVVPTVDVSFDYDDTAQYFGTSLNMRLNLWCPALHLDVIPLLPVYTKNVLTTNAASVWSVDPDFPMMFRNVYGTSVIRIMFWTVTSDTNLSTIYGFSRMYNGGTWYTLAGSMGFGNGVGTALPATLPSYDDVTGSNNILYSLFTELALNSGDWLKCSYCAKQYVLSVAGFVKVDRTSIICSFVKSGALVSGNLYNDVAYLDFNNTVLNSQLIIKSLNSSLLSDCELSDLEIPAGNYYIKSPDVFNKVVYLQKMD